MEARTNVLLLLVLMPVVLGAWINSKEERVSGRESRRGAHYHNKRHMLPTPSDTKKRVSPTPKPRDQRKKPSGHLMPLADDDMDNDEVVSVAIGPPSIRPKYEKLAWKHPTKRENATKTNEKEKESNNFDNKAVGFIKDVLTQLGREFLSNQVSENYVFGQYVGIAMRNLTNETRIKMQHDILDIIIKYQSGKSDKSENSKKNETNVTEPNEKKPVTVVQEEIKAPIRNPNEIRSEKKLMNNDAEDGWPDFSNLSKIVG